jgi:phosphatidylinositol alpha-mannosyltransferase
MSAGACVVASDLGAFRRVLDDGAAGALFAVGDPDALAAAVLDVLADPPRRDAYRARASEFVRRFDWSAVTAQVLAVYETVLAASEAVIPVHEDPRSRRGGRLLGRARDDEGDRP